MTTLVYIGGLGDDPTLDLNGFRIFANRMVERHGVNFLSFAYDQRYLVHDIAALAGDLICVGHSNGGDALMEVDDWFARIGREMHTLCLLDPKPRWNSLSGFFHWWGKYRYPIPKSTPSMLGAYRAFYGTFGCPFVMGVASTQLRLPGAMGGHASFPANPEVHDWIEQRIKEAA